MKLYKYYNSKEYKTYEFGKPDLAADELMDLVQANKKAIQASLNLAGPFLAPAIKRAFIEDFMLMIEKEVKLPQ